MKLNGHQIIIFGLPRLDAEIESTNYTTARLLAKYNRVYYVENPYTIKDYWSSKGTARYNLRKKYFSLFNTELVETDTPGLSVIIPPVLLSINFLPEGRFFRALLSFNEYLIAFKLKRFIRKYGIDKYLYINSFNFHYPLLADRLKARLQVYHCLDPLVLAFERKHGCRSEDIVIAKSDIVLCSSKQLFSEKQKINPATYFVPNAADLSHSIKVLDPLLQVNSLLAGVSKPVIGYFGAIERRIDYNLLTEVIYGNPSLNFVFVGPVAEEFVPAGFTEMKNVTFTGPVPYHQMPAMVKGFDVALIPFKKDEFSRTIFPLKLFEYLGAGKPVVCTDFNPDLADFTEDTVAYCSDAAEFSEAIHEALASDGTPQRERRIAVASANTWEKRVDEIAEIIFKGLLEKEMAEVFRN
ncbi:hypothetical protein DYBT9275_02116 [Dyadobacter sp. CECT 9275]|uniref:Uncharacterized protein n=1 Tax=Dyadobacter helix TaxID=2822344 RepID=A0A916N447_9BACT|nr:glycosyltransferase [Dyadobacter sp. CECT 9275]CAG4998952.1 hypothetical protein DYBT9275_02116 [Dyadobacter sp. CECT 9275]